MRETVGQGRWRLWPTASFTGTICEGARVTFRLDDRQGRGRCALWKTVSLCGVVAILALYNVWATGAQEADAAVREQITAAERAANPGPYATDGVFTGAAQGYGGLVTMQVTIEDGWIVGVQIADASQEDPPWLEMADVLLERILEAQSPNIDVVSGATFTSTGILNGTTMALIESMNGGEADGQ